MGEDLNGFGFLVGFDYAQVIDRIIRPLEFNSSDSF